MIAAQFPERKLIDLHTHSALSDGSAAPEDLLAQARRLGIRWLAVADHDSVGSYPRCDGIAAEAGIGLIPAVEITSVNPMDGAPLHILGYGVGPNSSEALESELAGVRQARTDWYRRGVQRLRAEGYQVTWTEVLKHATGGDVHRVHVMHALAVAGYTTRFKGYLYHEMSKPGAPLYGHVGYLNPDRAIDLIHQNSGVAVLAHPAIAGAIAACDLLVEMGIDGIEAFHPSHTPLVVEQALALARGHRLVVTGGSDYHGLYSEYDTTLGCPELTLENVEDLLARIHAIGRIDVTASPGNGDPDLPAAAPAVSPDHPLLRLPSRG